MGWRKDLTVPQDRHETAEGYYASVRAGLRDKANHNKLEAQGCFAAIIVCTLLAPLFVTLGEGFIWAKVVPSVLSVTAAALTTWLQLRKPQRLWALYRRAQRELEQAKANYDFNDAEFDGDVDKEKLLARKVTAVAKAVHDEWEGLIPEPEALGSTATKSLPEPQK
jgi:hypothetical protein